MIALSPLAGFAKRREVVAVAPSCELCRAPIGERHRHAVELGTRGVQCVCVACSLLFMSSEARLPYRTVPDRVATDPAFAMTPATWSTVGVPVSLAFFVKSGDGVAVNYPGPAGIVDGDLEPAAWSIIAAATPLAHALADDVEALLIHGGRGATKLACYLVPITTAFELAATLRTSWRGFSGGDETQQKLEAFFAELDHRGGNL